MERDWATLVCCVGYVDLVVVSRSVVICKRLFVQQCLDEVLGLTIGSRHMGMEAMNLQVTQ